MKRVYRSGASARLLWIGLALVGVGLVLFVLAPIAMAIVAGDPTLLLMLLGVPVFSGAGALMALAG